MNLLYKSLSILLLGGLLACNTKTPTAKEIVKEEPVAVDITDDAAVEARFSLLEEFGVEDEEEEYEYEEPSIYLYSLGHYVDNGKYFVSMSDTYKIEEDDDIMPNLKEMSKKELEGFPLNGEYRDVFLKGTKTSEADSVFVYNYVQDLLYSFAVKDLQVAALLNVYESVEDEYLSKYSYYIGFEIDDKLMKMEDAYFSYVYVGKENPFVRGGMKAMKWELVDTYNFPKKKIAKNDVDVFVGAEKGETYLSEDIYHRYYVQEYKNVGSEYMRLIVVNKQGDKVIADEVFGTFESSSPKPLNDIGGSEYKYQWAGSLLKNTSPIVLGFDYVSFGCESLLLIDGTNKTIPIHCDNRH